jgi:hypothetical protein
MKWLLAAGGVLSAASGALAARGSPIHKIVKLLEDMAREAEKEGREERKLFAKFKCYCDTNRETRTNRIKENETRINELNAKVAPYHTYFLRDFIIHGGRLSLDCS